MTRPRVFLVPAQFTDRWSWARLVPLLEPFADVEHVEPMRVDVAQYERSIRERIERAAVERPVAIAGASLGGWIAARVAATTSAPLAHVFVLSGLARLPAAMNAARLDAATALESGALALRDFATAMHASVAVREDLDAELDALLERHLGAWTLDEVVWSLRATAPLADDAWAVTRLDVPATILHGVRDQAVPLAIGEELAAVAPRARFARVETSSHLLAMTHAGLVADAMRLALT